MSDLNQNQKQFFSETGKKLAGAMEKFKFTQTLSQDEAEAISRDLREAQGSIALYEDINGSNKHIELLKATASFLEKTLNTLTHSHLV